MQVGTVRAVRGELCRLPVQNSSSSCAPAPATLQKAAAPPAGCLQGAARSGDGHLGAEHRAWPKGDGGGGRAPVEEQHEQQHARGAANARIALRHPLQSTPHDPDRSPCESGSHGSGIPAHTRPAELRAPRACFSSAGSPLPEARYRLSDPSWLSPRGVSWDGSCVCGECDVRRSRSPRPSLPLSCSPAAFRSIPSCLAVSRPKLVAIQTSYTQAAAR